MLLDYIIEDILLEYVEPRKELNVSAKHCAIGWSDESDDWLWLFITSYRPMYVKSIQLYFKRFILCVYINKYDHTYWILI